MTCKSPKVTGLLGNVSEVQAQFIMDGDVKLLSNFTKLTMMPDPFFERFKDDIHVLKTESLILEVHICVSHFSFGNCDLAVRFLSTSNL